MKKALKTKIRGLSKQEFSHLQSLCHAAKNLYNQALYIVRQEFITNTHYLNYNEMDTRMKQVINLEGQINYRMLKAGVSQQILRRLDKNFQSFFKAIVRWKQDQSAFHGRPQLPKYLKGATYNLLFDKQRFQVKDGHVVLDKHLSVQLPEMLQGKDISQVEILPKFHHFEIVYVYEDGQELADPVNSDIVMGIDLGLNNLATCTTTTGESVIINGKPLKSINQFYNKKKAALQSHLEKRQGEKWSVRLQRLTDTRNRKVNDYLHKATRKIVDVCLEQHVSQVIVGNVVHAQNGINLGKRTNQNFVNVPLGQFTTLLSYKLEEQGITLNITDESYTSKASFVDNDVLPKKYEPDHSYIFSGKRVKRGLYRTQEGMLVNADWNGANNIIKKVVSKFNYTQLEDGIEGRFIPHCAVVTCQ